MLDKLINFFTNNTFLHVFVGGFGLGLALYFGRYIKQHLLWVKGGIENNDGSLQNKELQIVFFSILSAFMIVSVAIWNVNYPDIAYVGVFGGAGLLYTINRMADAHIRVNGKHSVKKKDEDKDEGIL